VQRGAAYLKVIRSVVGLDCADDLRGWSTPCAAVFTAGTHSGAWRVCASAGFIKPNQTKPNHRSRRPQVRAQRRVRADTSALACACKSQSRRRCSCNEVRRTSNWSHVVGLDCADDVCRWSVRFAVMFARRHASLAGQRARAPGSFHQTRPNQPIRSAVRACTAVVLAPDVRACVRVRGRRDDAVRATRCGVPQGDTQRRRT
jgi:hypothetical protein